MSAQEPGAPIDVRVAKAYARSDQRVVTGRLSNLESLVRGNGITGPALIVVGDVAGLARTAGLGAVADPSAAVLAAAV